MALAKSKFRARNSPVAARGAGAKSRGALPTLRSFGPKTAIFHPKKPSNPDGTPEVRETLATSHVRLDFFVSESFLVPFNFTICPRNSPKRRQRGPKSALCAPTHRNQARAVSLAVWLTSEFKRARGPPARPHLLWFNNLENRPTRCLDPRTSGHLVEQEGVTPSHNWGQQWVHRGPPSRKKWIFQSCS